MRTIKTHIREFDFYNAFGKLGFKLNLKKMGFLPQWIIFFLDLSIIIFSANVTYILLKGLHLDFFASGSLSLFLPIYLMSNAFFFWSFNTYAGIIRHSSLTDALKLFFSQSSTFLTLIGLNFGFLLLGKPKLCLTTGLFISSVLSFSLLFIYRIIIKQLFDRLFLYNKADTIKAIVYGTGHNAIAIANALKSEEPRRFQIVGFIDKNNENSTKRIADLPIIKIKKNIPVMMRYMKIQAIIIADEIVKKEEEIEIVNDCIDNGFKVYSAPVVFDWNDKNQISKGVKNFEIHDLLERKPIVLDLNSISKKLKGKTILVTGGAGSIGSEIVRQILLFEPKKIVLLDQAETPLNNFFLEINSYNKSIETICCIGDIKDNEILESIFIEHSPDIVYHAAAYKHVPLMEENPIQSVLTNVLGTKNVADISQKYNVERFVMVSTDKAVNPSSIMGTTKRIAEMYVQSKDFRVKELKDNSQTKFITTRFGNVLGSNGSVVPLFAKQIQEGGPITITHPEIIRYFMTIPEACQLVLEAGSMGEGGEVYIFDMGKPIKILELAKKMIRLAGFTPEKDIKIKIVGLRPGEKLYEELLSDTAKNLPTHHEKIMVAMEVCDEHEKIKKQVTDLIRIAKSYKKEELILLMKEIVPEFKSLNAEYYFLNEEVSA